MPLTVRLIPCLEDNYAILIRDEASGQAAAIDVPDADVIIGELERLGWRLTTIFNTHKHGDHIGGNEALRDYANATVIAPAEVSARTQVNVVVGDGDRVALGATEFQILDTGGHTLGHVSYFVPDAEWYSWATRSLRWVAVACLKALLSKCGPACRASLFCRDPHAYIALTSIRPRTQGSRSV